MVPKSAPVPIWDRFTVSVGEDVTEEEARVIARFLNSPPGQAPEELDNPRGGAAWCVRVKPASPKRRTDEPR